MHIGRFATRVRFSAAGQGLFNESAIGAYDLRTHSLQVQNIARSDGLSFYRSPGQKL